MYLQITFYLILLYLLLSLCFGWSLSLKNSIAIDWWWNYFARQLKKQKILDPQTPCRWTSWGGSPSLPAASIATSPTGNCSWGEVNTALNKEKLEIRILFFMVIAIYCSDWLNPNAKATLGPKGFLWWDPSAWVDGREIKKGRDGQERSSREEVNHQLPTRSHGVSPT